MDNDPIYYEHEVVAKRRPSGEGTYWFNKSDGRWKAQITVNRQRIGKSAKTQKEVIDWLTEQNFKIKSGILVDGNQIRIEDFLNRYLKDVARHSIRPTTFTAYSNLVRLHINPVLGNIFLHQLRPDHVQSLYTPKINEGLSRRTVQYIHAVLHKALKQAFKWELVNRNVSDLVDVPKPRKKTFLVWTAEQVKQFLAAVEGHQWYTIYILATFTGMRQGEILGLQISDVDLDNGIIQVRHQLTNIRGEGLTITRPKTEKSRRPITIPKTALKALKGHLKFVEGDLIFTTRSGKPISPRNIVRHFKSVIEREGLPEIRFHDLRHTHASLLLEAGVHPKVVQERLGHSSISLTLDTYSHVIPSLQSEAADQVESMLS